MQYEAEGLGCKKQGAGYCLPCKEAKAWDWNLRFSKRRAAAAAGDASVGSTYVGADE